MAGREGPGGERRGVGGGPPGPELDLEAQGLLGPARGFADKVRRPQGAAPRYLRSAFILDGYRVGLDAGECARSLCACHNESGNVWTHLVPAAHLVWVSVQCATLLRDRGAPVGDHVALQAFLFSALLCLSCSCAFHLFGCHSERVYGLLFKLDVMGICGLIAGSFAPGLFFAFHCFPGTRAVYALLLGGLLGTAVLTATVPGCPSRARVAALSAAAGFGLVPLAHWCLLVTAEDRALLVGRLLGMFGLFGLGFALWSYELPERLWPGRFDLWLHSHQLWHLCVVGAIYVWLWDLLDMQAWQYEVGCPAAAF